MVAVRDALMCITTQVPEYWNQVCATVLISLVCLVGGGVAGEQAHCNCFGLRRMCHVNKKLKYTCFPCPLLQHMQFYSHLEFDAAYLVTGLSPHSG